MLMLDWKLVKRRALQFRTVWSFSHLKNLPGVAEVISAVLEGLGKATPEQVLATLDHNEGMQMRVASGLIKMARFMLSGENFDVVKKEERE